MRAKILYQLLRKLLNFELVALLAPFTVFIELVLLDPEVSPELLDPELLDPELLDPELLDPELLDPEPPPEPPEPELSEI
jgi:hypothetical protein